jgi:hypothetical protein
MIILNTNLNALIKIIFNPTTYNKKAPEKSFGGFD